MPRFTSTIVALFTILVLIFAEIPLTAYADPNSWPNVSDASAWIITDANGIVYAAQNEDSELPPESITKIMTAMVVLDSDLSFADVVEVPELPSYWENAQVAGLRPGSFASVGDLFQMMLVYSANDAAYTLAVAVSGTEDAFVALMNQKAAALHLDHTHFACSSGMETSRHYASAKDLCRMGRYAVLNYPLIASCVQEPSCSVEVNGSAVTFYSTDHLLHDYPYARGIKTGAGTHVYTFLGTAVKNNVQLFTCVLDCHTEEGRFTDTKSLFEWAYNDYLSTIALGTLGEPFPRKLRFAFRFGFYLSAYYPETSYFSLPEQNGVAPQKIPSSPRALVLPNTTYNNLCSWYVNGDLVASQTLATNAGIQKSVRRDFLKPWFLT